MPREPKIRRDVPWAWAASTIARASRRKSASPRATKDGSFGMIARGWGGRPPWPNRRRMWEARRSQRASRESLGPYKDAHVASLTNRNVRGKSLMNGRPVTGRGSGGEARGRSRRFRETGAAGDRASPSVHATGLGARPGHVTVLGVRVQHPEHRDHFPLGVHYDDHPLSRGEHLAGDLHHRYFHRLPGRRVRRVGFRDASDGRRLCVPESDATPVAWIRHRLHDDHYVLPSVASARWMAGCDFGLSP